GEEEGAEDLSANGELRLVPAVSRQLASEIEAAGGREVCFVATLDAAGVITGARAVARGTADMVLALPGVARAGEMVLHNHPSGLLEPSGADLHVAARLHDGGIGFGIIDNLASALYVVVEVSRTPPAVPIDPFDVIAALGEQGPVAAMLGGYEDRPSQRDMAAHIADSYNEGGVAVLEAGTGVGKSFAYLVPALAWARANRERTIVSTNTINLQEQLVGKDLPLLARGLADGDYTPTFALLKGWRNYVCLARLEQAVTHQQSLLEADRLDELAGLFAWAGRTADGTIGDLPVTPSAEVWDEVAAEPDLCTRLRCPHFERCFLFRARRRAAEADVVVVNHHLLAADLAVRQASDNWQEAAVLPPYQRLILDEAHHLEDVAAAHLGIQVSSRSVRRVLGRFERSGRGLIPALAVELAGSTDLLSRASLDVLQGHLIPALVEARRAADGLFARLASRLAEVPGGVLRVGPDFAEDPVWEEGLTGGLHAALSAFRRMRDDVELIGDRLSTEEVTERRAQLLLEIRGVSRRLDAIADGLTRALQPGLGEAPTVRWIERSDSRGGNVALHAVPLDLAPILREALFDRLRTVVLTSATLAAGGEFGFLEKRTGLAIEPNPVTVREVLPSPFDYGAQCLLGVPTDLPDPRDDELGHDQAVAHVVGELAAACDGGMFVLFTSHAALRRLASALRSGLGPQWPLLVQGEAPRDQLLRRFRESGRAILLGTESFWEGVDVPGRALRALVLSKLPFKVPGEPLTAARLERLAEQGEDGFWGYLLPHAALKLKQGFGRLIRSRRDVGVVVLLDRRVVTKRYGPLVLEGLPPADRVIGPWAEVRTKCEDFFDRFGIGAEV
ncbi:MAG TPA: helicase C-terminal domain-containing protein, partial [Gemmatimonadales bacterium]|nr:helicase C-terminal domain-containing protein [Gemmatimonadales bacterium]